MSIDYHQAIIILIGCWVLAHVLYSFSLVGTSNNKIVMIACMVLIILVYIFKPVTGDLPKYSSYFSTGYLAVHPFRTLNAKGIELDPRDLTGEPFDQAFRQKIWGSVYSGSGFTYLSKFLHSVLPKGNFLPRISNREWFVADFAILFFMVLSLGILVVTANFLFSSLRRKNSSKETLLVCIPIVMGSVFYMVGSQNSIRQFLSISLIFLAFSLITKKRYIFSIVAVVGAASIHNWALMFAVVSFPIVLVLEKIRLNNIERHSCPFGQKSLGLSGLVAGILVVITIETLLSLPGNEIHYLIGDLRLISDLELYVSMDYSHQLGRISGLSKLVLVGSLVVISELILGNRVIRGEFDIRSFRMTIFLFIIPLVIYPELLSRLMIFYLAAEMFFVIGNAMVSDTRAKMTSAVIFLTYAIAPNALTILAGPELFNLFD